MSLLRKLATPVSMAALAAAMACGGDGGTGPSKSLRVDFTANPPTVQLPGTSVLTGNAFGVNGGTPSRFTIIGPNVNDVVTGPFNYIKTIIPDSGQSRYIACASGDAPTVCDTVVVTGIPAQIPTAQLRTAVTPSNVVSGQQVRLGAKLYNIQNGKADSIEAIVGGSPKSALGDSLDISITPTASGTVQFIGFYSRADGTSPQTATDQKAITVQNTFAVQLVDMDGNPLTQTRTMLIDGQPYTSNSQGIISAPLTQGVRRIGYARTDANDTTATRLELPASYQDPVRIIFPRFKINQNATAGEDTVTVSGNVTARAVIAGQGANFNKQHYEGYFDDSTYGQQGPRGNTVRFHILKQPNAKVPSCQAMSAGALATWRQFQSNQAGELQGYYNVVNTEADTLPTTLTTGDYVVLCQGPVVSNGTQRGPNGEYTVSDADIGVNTPMGDANSEALLAVYGSSGIEGKCAVLSVFNDGNPVDPACTMGGSPTPTAYDRREGLDMMKNFAIIANNRAMNTNTFTTGNTKIFFSLRK